MSRSSIGSAGRAFDVAHAVLLNWPCSQPSHRTVRRSQRHTLPTRRDVVVRHVGSIARRKRVVALVDRLVLSTRDDA
uniref:DUF1990 family protein n=1 Tax=Roseiconus lacunae TaxID=2605694 RepID=UPI0033162E7D